MNIYTKADYPVEWSKIQHNLASIYVNIDQNKADNIEQAITLYHNILTIHTKEDFPIYWAMIQNGLGLAYENRINGKRAENIERAKVCFQQALIVYIPQSFPLECWQNAFCLGNIASNQANWQLAVEAYALAIEAVEQIRSWASGDKSKQEILSEAIDAYQNIVQACINLGQIDKAIEYAERSKSRNLVELLAIRDLYPKGNIPQEVIDRLKRLRRKIIVEERRLEQSSSGLDNSERNDQSEGERSTSAMSSNSTKEPSQLARLRQQIEELLAKEINHIDPDFQLTQRVEPISFEEIQASLPTPQTVLVEWYLGNDTLTAFIVTSQQQIPIHLTYSAEQLEELTNKAGEYLGIYLQRDNQWQNRLPVLLFQLAKHLQLATIIERIKEIIPDVNRLILVPHRWLHLLPLHALTLPTVNVC